MSISLAPLIQDIRIGSQIRHHNLTIFPLYNSQSSEIDYQLLEEAMTTGQFKIEEVSEQGRVPFLQARNQTNSPILILSGELLEGAKQNRIANASYLLAAQSETTINVSCVEQGRWGYRSRDFSTGTTIYAAKARSRKQASVSESLRRTSSYQSNQSEIWRDVDTYLHTSSTRSGTSNYSDYLAKREGSFVNYESLFPYQEGQIGQIVYLNDQFLALDSLDQPHKSQRIYSKLLRSYIQDALDMPESELEHTQSSLDAEQIFERLKNLEAEANDSVSLGQDLRFEDEQIQGAALIHSGQILHLEVFPKDTTISSRRRY